MNIKILVALSVVSFTLFLNNAAQACPGSKSSNRGGQKLMANESKDIVDTAVGAGSFNTLTTALTKANLIDTLKGAGPFTVFAPTDEAFKKIPANDLQGILNDNNLLTKILTYHVVLGELKATDVLKASSLQTVEGSPVAISMNVKAAKIGNATITQTDIQCKNGVIHVIDSVLVPDTK